MVHRIHGAALQTRDFIIYGHGGSENNFSDVGFPGELNNCSHCHVNGSYNVPLPRTNVAMVDPRGLLSPVNAGDWRLHRLPYLHRRGFARLG